MRFEEVTFPDYDSGAMLSDKLLALESVSEEILVEEVKSVFNCIDLTTLSITDNSQVIKNLCDKVNYLEFFSPETGNIAAICVYPSLVKEVKKNLAIKEVKIASVAGSFPSSQTFISIKKAEIEEAIKLGADEIDVVISLGKFKEGKYQVVFDELTEIRKSSENKTLKVILETGLMEEEADIHRAAYLALFSGADFLKTSTGKNGNGATFEAVAIMTRAVVEFYKMTGKRVGIKPSGGVSSVKSALSYYSIVKYIAGNEWMNKQFFRIGASKLANNLLIELQKKANKEIVIEDYF